ncbi:MAG: SusC/RagA family TonB-linked outer membrane protein [Bacteroidetes bacterium]|nr:SusC/RagA family TonB-linked outer membrane protein [Bacteroidota bacterium]
MKGKILFKRLLFLVLCMSIVASVFGQEISVSGVVTDAASGFPLPGVNILEKGTTNGTITDLDGNFSITVGSDATLVFSFVGYLTQGIIVGNQTTINVSLEFDVQALEEVVTIGYGTTRKEDVTGSVIAISSDDFNRGAITSPQELIAGKIAGVQITNAGGAPGAASTIRIRGGSSLSASNDPLIVIDGVPVDNDGISGMRNPLNTIHPNDIETFTVLKDASATAIFGSRASNGVIIITTKKGRANRPLTVNYDGNVSIGTRTGEVDVLSADEYRSLIQEQFANNPNATDLLGSENTNWQKEIYQTAISHDHNLSLSGSVENLSFVDNLPFRVSLGYSDQKGILKTSGLDRFTGAINLNPSFLDDHLRINLSAKGMYIKNQFADWGAVGSAVAFDPTQPVLDATSQYGGYFTWTQPNGDPITIATSNPVALLEMRDDNSTVKRSIGNVQFDYKFHFLPELKAKLNLGYDISESDGDVFVPENAAWLYNALVGGGEKRLYTQNKKNELLDLYFNYVKDLGSFDSRIDATAGYSWQHFWRKGTSYSTNVAETIVNTDTDYETESYLVSFFGRLNYVFKDRYMLTFTLRQDGSSRFSEDNRWGLFPSVALAWDIADEPLLGLSELFNSLKLRLGYGITGQQNISNNDYPYLARYTYSEDNAQYQFGSGFVTTLRPEGYDANIKWEETTTYNIGLDYGLLNNRFSGAVDLYYRETDDLINFIPVPAGTNLTNQILTNVGDLVNKGIEFTINAKTISKADMVWEIGFNATYNENEITKLTATDDPEYLGVFTGGISGGVGNNIQIHSVGFPANSFYVYKQVYDEDGDPIEGLYVDTNGDDQLTVDDRYRYKKAAPDVFLGFSSFFQYQNWDFSFAGRVNLGNYVYNNVYSNNGTYSGLYNSVGYLNNVTTSLLDSKFSNPKYWSDYYMENGSFLRLDNLTLGYNLSNIINGISKIRLYGTVQNVLLITKYQGLDPEVSSGIDNNLYPRPRNFLFGVSVEF